MKAKRLPIPEQLKKPGKMRLLFRVLFFIGLIGGQYSLQAQTDSAELQRIFQNYRTALQNRDADQAIAQLNRRTTGYYDSMLQVVRFADSAALSRHGVMSQLLVLAIRLQVPESEIRVMRGKDLLAFGIRNGMVGVAGLDRAVLGYPHIKGSMAKVPLWFDGQQSKLSLRFDKEGLWRLDMIDMMAAGEAGLQTFLQNEGIETAIFLRSAIKRSFGIEAPVRIWRPVG
jgi:hypothetical protein